MGTTQSKHEECESEEVQQMKRLIEEKGVAAAQTVMKEKLEEWRNVEIKIGVTGNSGVGKSSFINAFRGIDDEDESAAKTDVVEATSEPACYTYPGNPKITLMDLPGIGTPTYRDLEVYCKNVGLETYDTFLILTAERFTQLELELAQKIKSMEKSFFLIRTKIDMDELNDKRKKSHDMGEMLRKIRAYCYESVKDLEIREDEVFLISNFEKDKWDFERLVQAVLGKLSTDQKEALTLSLKILSKDIVKRKVEVLRSQLWRVKILFYAALPIDLVTLPFNAICLEVAFFKGIFENVKSYRLQEDSDEFQTSSQPTVSEEDSDEFQTSSQPTVSEEDSDELEMEPIGLASIPIALSLLGRKTKFYRSQLGLPEEDSDEFKMMKPEFQTRMRKLYPREDKGFWKRCFAIVMKPSLRLLRFWSRGPPPPSVVAMNSLNRLLDEMQQLSLDVLDEAATRT